LNGLPDRIADVIRLRFGLDDRGDHTLEEIGQKYGVTRERIRQLEAKGLAILAHSSRTRVLRTLLNS
jgi:RNA polymerase primary sigma factor